MVNGEIAEKARARAEKERERKARMRDSWASERGRKHHGAGRQDGRIPYREYEFVMWDGEAPQDTGYSLFGCSLGYEVRQPRLNTEQCFDLMLAVKRQHPETIHIVFGGRYDWDEICRQSMPVDRLARLKNTGHVMWHGYRVKQLEGKAFTVKKDGVTVTVYEIFGWFHKSYVKALTDYQIGSKEELELLSAEKSRRGEFLWAEIDEIAEYMRLELKLGPLLMNRIRDICLAAGFNPRAWYGPSALALEALRVNDVKKAMGTVPASVRHASQMAFAGGRFEDVRGGILSPVFSYDENSAYMSAALALPNLAKGKWRAGKDYEPGKFGVYHIRYDASRLPYDPARIHPLFMRHKNGMVNWPPRCEGWYWAPEAELVKDSPYAEFLAAYIYDEWTSERPFEFVGELFRKRLVLESLPEANPSRKAGKAFKWALASIYGQLCRGVGWDKRNKRAPRYHQLEWAGYITSKCRADMHKVALQAGDNLISIDTDSVTAMCPLTVPEGRELGEWKAEAHDRGVFFQSGVYALERGGRWVTGRARGD